MSKEKLAAKIQISKSNHGITLVALIVTIVIMLILVAVTLLVVLGENGVINNAKESKEETNIEIEKEKLLDAVFATAGSNGEINLENIVLPEGFTEISKDENKTIYQGPSGQQYEVDNITGEIKEIEELVITPETQGVTFTKSDGVTLGDPNNLKNKDIVTYGDYKYTYSSSSQGWSVAVLDKTKEVYGEIATAIYGKPIISVYESFKNCTNMKVAPEIPDSVTNMNHTFNGCSSLVEAPNIPNGVTDIYATFNNCTSLTKAPEIPNGITNMDHTFNGCSSLKYAPKIPTGVTNMNYTFGLCNSLVETPQLPEGLIDMTYTFKYCILIKKSSNIPSSVKILKGTYNYCSSLIEAPIIPNGVENMDRTFSGCGALTQISEIPSSIKNMDYTFDGCRKLQGEIVINATPTTYTGCFNVTGTNGTGIVLKGSSTVLNELAATNAHGKVAVGN